MFSLRMSFLSTVLIAIASTLPEIASAQSVCGEFTTVIQIRYTVDAVSFDPGDRIGHRGIADLWNNEENENFFWFKVSIYPTEDENQSPIAVNHVITSVPDAGAKSWQYRSTVETPPRSSCPGVVYSYPELGYVPSDMEDAPEQAVGMNDYNLDTAGYYSFNWVV